MSNLFELIGGIATLWQELSDIVKSFGRPSQTGLSSHIRIKTQIPRILKTAIAETQSKADPKSVVFEPMVIRDLMLAGFRVTPQWKVDPYTIDIVVEGANAQIAIECDGDRFHPPEQRARDIQRQLALERLGWKFIRIRGQEYFKCGEVAMQRAIAALDALGVERLGPAGTDIGELFVRAEMMVPIDPRQISSFLKDRGFEVIDKRPVGGSLWVIDRTRI